MSNDRILMKRRAPLMHPVAALAVDPLEPRPRFGTRVDYAGFVGRLIELNQGHRCHKPGCSECLVVSDAIRDAIETVPK